MYNSAMTSDKQELWHSDEALADLLRGPEGDLVEWKESAKGDAVPKAICAFANDLHDRRSLGVVFVGADDKKGKPTGLAIDEELLNNLAGVRSEGNILPPPSLRVTPLSAEGGRVACVQVMPSPSPPVQFKGRIYVRDGASTRVAVAADEHVLAEKRRLRDAPFELRPFPAASMEKDLDLQYFEKKYLSALVPPEVLAENDRSLEQRLAASKMIAGADDPTPTALGLLVAGVNAREFLSGAHVQFLRIDGDELGENIIDAEEIYGNIAQVVRDSEKKMRAYNQVAVKYVTVPLEERSWLYPPMALEQIFRNAILHRSYEKMTSPVVIRWYNDRVEIISPGGPFGAPPGPDFPPKGLQEYRNPGLAEAMKALELVQRYGTGMDQARRAMEKNGSPPLECESTPYVVICTLRAKTPERIPARDFRLSPKSVISLAQFLHMVGDAGHLLLRKHGIAESPSDADTEAALKQAAPGQLRELLDEIGRARMALLRQASDDAAEKERRENKSADAETYNRLTERARESAEAAFAGRFEDLRVCLREDGYRLCE